MFRVSCIFDGEVRGIIVVASPFERSAMAARVISFANLRPLESQTSKPERASIRARKNEKRGTSRRTILTEIYIYTYIARRLAPALDAGNIHCSKQESERCSFYILLGVVI